MEAQLAMLKELVPALQHANDTRYLSAVGFVVLLYDHLLTFELERKYVWNAPRSFSKFAFLFNRYMVLCCLVAITCDMCGFSFTLTDWGCKSFLFTMSMFGIASIGIANVLVLLRVFVLWERRPIIFRLMFLGFACGFTSQFVCMILANIALRPHVSWSPIAKMCVVTDHTTLYIAVWASPLLFEILVLIFTVVNALDRPRTAHTHLFSALLNDGAAYFVTLTCLRVLNLALAATANPTLTLLTVFFVWAMSTTILNRSLLNQQDSEATSGRDSPFGPQDNLSVVDMEVMTGIRVGRLRDEVDEDGIDGEGKKNSGV